MEDIFRVIDVVLGNFDYYNVEYDIVGKEVIIYFDMFKKLVKLKGRRCWIYVLFFNLFGFFCFWVVLFLGLSLIVVFLLIVMLCWDFKGSFN